MGDPSARRARQCSAAGGAQATGSIPGSVLGSVPDAVSWRAEGHHAPAAAGSAPWRSRGSGGWGEWGWGERRLGQRSWARGPGPSGAGAEAGLPDPDELLLREAAARSGQGYRTSHQLGARSRSEDAQRPLQRSRAAPSPGLWTANTPHTVNPTENRAAFPRGLSHWSGLPYALAMPLPIGTRLRPYEILGPLGAA
jgi:hypothetical protein